MSRVSLEDALDDCLKRLPTEGLDVCLRRYPQYAAELRDLLLVARQLTVTATPQTLSLDVRERVRARLFSAAPPSPPSVEPLRPDTRFDIGRFFRVGWSGLAMRAALMLLILIFAGWGATAASAHAVPGDLLYPVKRFSEGVRLDLSFTKRNQVDARLDFAAARLDEIETLFRRKAAIGSDLFADLDDNITYCTNQLSTDDPDRPQLAHQLAVIAQRGRSVLSSVSKAVAADAKSTYQRAQSSTTAAYDHAIKFTPPPPSPTPALPLPSPTGLLPTATLPSTLPTVAATDTLTVPSSSPTPAATVTATLVITMPTLLPTPLSTDQLRPTPPPLFTPPTTDTPSLHHPTKTPTNTPTSTPTRTPTPLPAPHPTVLPSIVPTLLPTAPASLPTQRINPLPTTQAGGGNQQGGDGKDKGGGKDKGSDKGGNGGDKGGGKDK